MSISNFVQPRDLTFWLYDLDGPARQTGSDAPALPERPDFAAMLDSVTRLADSAFAGLPELLDANEPRFDGKTVWNHERLKPALEAYLASGFFSAPFAERWGGMDMPFAVAQALTVPVNAAAGTGMGYLFLTAAAASMLDIVGSEAQKRRYMPKLVSGQWFGIT